MTHKSKTMMHQSQTPPPLSSRSKDINPPLPPTRESELVQILHLLTLAYHRNRNQHRRSRWWKELSLLRRNLRRLLEVEGNDGVRKGGPEKMKKEDDTDGRGERERRLLEDFLRETILPRCWVAFSDVVADNQYAALGLMLLGTLARLGNVLGLNFKAEQGGIGARDVGVGGGEVGREEDVVTLGDEDLGVPLVRDELVETREAGSEEDGKEYVMSEEKTVVAETEKLPEKKKRKKKHRDPIDELFSGLL